MTGQSNPGVVAPPAPTAISQTYISVIWQPPQLTNGPNIWYELLRMKLRQPLQGQCCKINKASLNFLW